MVVDKVALTAIVMVEQLGPWMGVNMVVKKDTMMEELSDTHKVGLTEQPRAA